VVVDLKTMAFEAVTSPAASGQSISGIEVVVLAISKKVNAVLTGYCSPTAEKYLSASGIEVLTGVSGTVSEVVEQYKKGDLLKDMGVERESESRRSKIDGPALFHALKNFFQSVCQPAADTGRSLSTHRSLQCIRFKRVHILSFFREPGTGYPVGSLLWYSICGKPHQ